MSPDSVVSGAATVQVDVWSALLSLLVAVAGMYLTYWIGRKSNDQQVSAARISASISAYQICLQREQMLQERKRLLTGEVAILSAARSAIHPVWSAAAHVDCESSLASSGGLAAAKILSGAQSVAVVDLDRELARFQELHHQAISLTNKVEFEKCSAYPLSVVNRMRACLLLWARDEAVRWPGILKEYFRDVEVSFAQPLALIEDELGEQIRLRTEEHRELDELIRLTRQKMVELHPRLAEVVGDDRSGVTSFAF